MATRLLTKAAFVLVLVLSQVHGISFCQDMDEENKIMTVEGSLVQVDWVGSKIVVRGGGDVGEEEISINILPDTCIFRGDEEITADDIEQGDHVTVKYYLGDDGVYEARKIIAQLND